MSKLIGYIVILLIYSVNTLWSQNNGVLYIFIDKNTCKESFNYSIDEEQSQASFFLYRKGFETKKKRDSVATAYRKRDKTKLPPGPPIPKSINFLSFEDPEKLTSLEGFDKISVKEFRENELKYLYTKTIYIIHPHNDGYLKWKVETLPTE